MESSGADNPFSYRPGDAQGPDNRREISSRMQCANFSVEDQLTLFKRGPTLERESLQRGDSGATQNLRIICLHAGVQGTSSALQIVTKFPFPFFSTTCHI